MPIPTRPKTMAGRVRVSAQAGVNLFALLVTSPDRLLKLLWTVRRHMSTGERTGQVSPDERRRNRRRAVGLLAASLPLARLRPDIVHFEWHSAAAHFLPLFDVWGCPVTTSCRGSDIAVHPHIPGSERYSRRLPEVLARVSAVHCVSESLKREAGVFGLDPSKARVVRPAVDPQVFRPAALNGAPETARDSEVMRVAMVGWLRWEKGHEYGLEAIRALLDQGVPVRLEMLGAVPSEQRGEADEAARILHTLSELGLEEHVRMRGEVSSAEISRRLQASAVLLHASVTEGIPNAIVEAMACGLPVVATSCGGVPEAVTDGIEGFLVALRDPEEMARALLRLWEDAGLRKRMGEAGRRKVLSEFTLDHEHAALLEMYRQVARA
jgi:colanic acid/amylovoran biosynthesis glycosyltransferase